MNGLVSAVGEHYLLCAECSSHTAEWCPWALMVSCWLLLGILWLALHTGWCGVTAHPVTQTAAAQLIGWGWPTLPPALFECCTIFLLECVSDCQLGFQTEKENLIFWSQKAFDTGNSRLLPISYQLLKDSTLHPNVNHVYILSTTQTFWFLLVQ